MLKFKNLLESLKVFFELYFRSDKKITYAIKHSKLSVIDGKYYVEIHYQIIITLGTSTRLINMNSREKMIDKLIKYTSALHNNYMDYKK
jgi:hypothetical protein